MISIINSELPLMPSTPATIRIMSLYEAYGYKYDFLRFYVQKIDGLTTMILSIMDNHCTLYATDKADISEIVDFLIAIGADTVFSERELPFDVVDSGNIMFLENKSKIPSTQNKVKLQNVYNIMSTHFNIPNYEAWYTDISHRIRHGCAVAVEKEHGSAVALKSSIGAVLSGICVDRSSRLKGLGSLILNEIIALSGNSLYVLVKTDGPKAFYEINGFSSKGKFATYKVK